MCLFRLGPIPRFVQNHPGVVLLLFALCMVPWVVAMMAHTYAAVLLGVSVIGLGGFWVVLNEMAWDHHFLSLRKDIFFSRKVRRVYVNGVLVGSFPDSAYAKILHDTRYDAETWLQLLANLFLMLRNYVIWLIKYVPVTFFWLCALYAMLDAKGFAETVAALQDFKKIESARVAIEQFVIFSTLVASSLGWLMAAHDDLGFVNPFRERTHEAIRKAVACPANGFLYVE